MEPVTMILFAVSLISQAVLLCLFVAEKKHNQRRYTAILDYIDRVNDGSCGAMETELHELRMKLREHEADNQKSQDELINKFTCSLQDECQKFQSIIDTLKLDFSQAQEAANKINDFGASLANIFDYDPMRALQKGRNKEAS